MEFQTEWNDLRFTWQGKDKSSSLDAVWESDAVLLRDELLA